MSAIDPRTIIPMPALDRADGAAQLQLRTWKDSRGLLCSSVSTYFAKDGALTCILFQDFAKVYARNLGRATQKALDSQHAAVFTPAAVDAIKAEVIAFYAARAKEVKQ